MAEFLFETEGPLAWLTFNRPEARNAMTWAMYEGLMQACETVDNDPALQVLILKGAGGKAFVAGTDISQFREFKTAADGLDYEKRQNAFGDRLARVTKPTIAMITGFAVGGGAGIALACDLRYCTPESQIGVPIARTLGNCLSTHTLGRIVDLLGPARTKEMIFRARLFTAEEGLAAGICNAIVPAEQIEQRVREIALEIAGHAPVTIRVTKEAIRRLAEHRAAPEAEDLIAQAYTSEDFREGVRAFLEKRKPIWTGR